MISILSEYHIKQKKINFFLFTEASRWLMTEPKTNYLRRGCLFYFYWVCKNNIFKNGSTISCTWYYCSASSQFTSQQMLVSNWFKFMYYTPMNNVFTSSRIVLFFVYLCEIYKIYIVICINVMDTVYLTSVIFEAEHGDTMCEHKMSLTPHEARSHWLNKVLLGSFSQKKKCLLI